MHPFLLYGKYKCAEMWGRKEDGIHLYMYQLLGVGYMPRLYIATDVNEAL